MREPLFDNDIHPLRHPEIYCLEMVDSREMTRQTDSLAAKAITEVACAPDELKCRGSLRHYLRAQSYRHHTVDCLQE